MDDNPHWVLADGKKGVGKVCFRCRGDGIEPGDNLPDPLAVRANVVTKLKPLVQAGEVLAIAKLARQFQSGPFWPVLEDAFQRAETAAKAPRSARAAAGVAQARLASQRAPEPPPPVVRTRTVHLDDFLSRGLNAYFAEVLDKHHPDASAEELAEAMGGFATFGGEVFFDVPDDDDF
jgi:hypothetical protein